MIPINDPTDIFCSNPIPFGTEENQIPITTELFP